MQLFMNAFQAGHNIVGLLLFTTLSATASTSLALCLVEPAKGEATEAIKEAKHPLRPKRNIENLIPVCSIRHMCELVNVFKRPERRIEAG